MSHMDLHKAVIVCPAHDSDVAADLVSCRQQLGISWPSAHCMPQA